MNATSNEVQDLIEKMREAEQNPGVPMRLAGEDLVVVMSTDSGQMGEVFGSWVAGGGTDWKAQDEMMRGLGHDLATFSNYDMIESRVMVMKGWDDQRIVVLFVGGVCYRVYYYEVSRIYVRRDRPRFEKAVPATPRNTRTPKKEN